MTRLGLYGGARQDYGLFSPKAGAPKSSDQLTRLGLYGGARQLYGTFSGKAESTGIVSAIKSRGFMKNMGGMM